MNKRTFLRRSAALGLGSLTSLSAVARWIERHSAKTAQQLASDDDFWAGIREGYRLKSEYINLENGYYCFVPTETLEKYIRHVREINEQGSYYMRNRQTENKAAIVARLAQLAGCGPEEIALTRNTTEALDTVINGITWREGDEAVMAVQDYGSIVNMFKLMQKRYGIVCRELSVPNHPASDEEIVDLYRSALNPRTKLLLISHMVNITGQILPVKKICAMAHGLNVPVLVDGAHTFGHLNFKIPDLGCDYFGTSLHKWLSVPLGAGLLYVKKEKVSGLWALMADWDMKDDISHLAHRGTHPVATDLAVADAIDFYLAIGPERKEERLRYLQNYWTARVRGLKNLAINTPADPARACAIANVGIKGMKPADMAKTLFEKYRIWTVAIDGQGVQGCRITPNVFTTTAELDSFVAALKQMAVG